jgi:hypothetical protein
MAASAGLANRFHAVASGNVRAVPRSCCRKDQKNMFQAAGSFRSNTGVNTSAIT